MRKKEIKNTVEINAKASKVWDVLTKSEYTKVYMFGCDVITDWKVGSSLLWQMEYEGKPMIPVSGYVLGYRPYEALEFSVIDPSASYPQTPENHLNVRYILSENANKTKLTVVQSGFEEAADGEQRYLDVYNEGLGWQPILEQMKVLSEK